MNEQSKKPLPSWLPLVVGGLLVLQFFALSIWQISRGLEKRATQHAYKDEVSFVRWQEGQEVRPYQHLQVSGRFDAERQMLLENIIVDSRLGAYVITPLVFDESRPPLLINRGWVPSGTVTLGTVTSGTVPKVTVPVRGRVGALPRAGYKMGDAVTRSAGWPKTAVYPSLEDVAAAYDEPLQPFVLLMDHEDPHGFYRHWVPTEFGPGKHFGYALQWFAMGTVLLGLLIWNYRKKRFA